MGAFGSKLKQNFAGTGNVSPLKSLVKPLPTPTPPQIEIKSENTASVLPNQNTEKEKPEDKEPIKTECSGCCGCLKKDKKPKEDAESMKSVPESKDLQSSKD